MDEADIPLLADAPTIEVDGKLIRANDRFFIWMPELAELTAERIVREVGGIPHILVGNTIYGLDQIRATETSALCERRTQLRSEISYHNRHLQSAHMELAMIDRRLLEPAPHHDLDIAHAG